ncbi:hypothetical protein B0T24DRAFT_271066 [Lasiosphaeria ovina]|uniref:Uncharacterized protein n=1 Tax=Lasiosphaeria ovina TaxID=92902 RepID=A0AAE0KCU1_9PEZI|nr:hypothetical protein B0T24DRAFT_271066 [Lasiosphaeria ovina]
MEKPSIIQPGPLSFSRGFSAPPRTPPPAPLRRPPGPLKLGPYFQERPQFTETIWFRFRTRTIQATASPVNGLNQNVLRLHIRPTIVQRIVQALVRLLPSFVGAWLESSFPEWNLPSQVILKKQKEGWDEEFDMEKETYAQLRPLQGIFVPKFFGELRHDNIRALLFSVIGGACLADPEGGLLEVADFRRMLCETVTTLSRFGIIQDDEKLDNFHFTGDKIMAVDFERVNDHRLTDEQLELNVKFAVDTLVRRYEDNQYCLWHDGLLQIDGEETKRDG